MHRFRWSDDQDNLGGCQMEDRASVLKATLLRGCSTVVGKTLSGDTFVNAQQVTELAQHEQLQNGEQASSWC